MFNRLRSSVIGITAFVCLASSGWSQSLSEQFTAASLPAGWVNTAGAGGAVYTFPGGSAQVVTTGFLQFATLTTPALASQSGAAGQGFRVFVFASTSATPNGILQVGVSGNPTQSVVLTTTPTNYWFDFVTPAASVSVDFSLFNIGDAGGLTLTLDNVFINPLSGGVPEINAASATLPLSIVLGALLLAYDRRRVLGVACTTSN